MTSKTKHCLQYIGYVHTYIHIYIHTHTTHTHTHLYFPCQMFFDFINRVYVFLKED